MSDEYERNNDEKEKEKKPFSIPSMPPPSATPLTPPPSMPPPSTQLYTARACLSNSYPPHLYLNQHLRLHLNHHLLQSQ